ncbi:MAG: hypothetical protein FIB08_14045 [Candidatus Methanoperedens sp.]|nr:hypothetical protein [Candidatus Methanoperedens sp.]
MIPDAIDLAEYIRMNYRKKVVEVGVGSLPQVALLLKDTMEVIITDIKPQPVFNGKYTGIKYCMDDILNPDISIYNNASLIYSIRPPVDIQEAIAKIAKQVGADLIIRPFGNEKGELGSFYKNHDLMNYKKARFYLYKDDTGKAANYIY